MADETGKHIANCRHCNAPLEQSFVDLGLSPLCQTHISPDQLNQMEPFYPLHAYICSSCLLVQLEEFVAPENIFSEYAYFSSYSDSWVAHAKRYAEQMIERFELNSNSQVMEIASNDGYLLQHFVHHKIPVLGIEPAANIAKVANEKGIKTIAQFHSANTAKELTKSHGQADLLLGNNVLAHVPELNDFVQGMKLLLKPEGVITMEFPHLVRLMEENQFDTIYHEHFSYFSFLAVNALFKNHQLPIFQVEQLNTHGGSLRIYAQHEASGIHPTHSSVEKLLEEETEQGYGSLDKYCQFTEQVKHTKRKLLQILCELKESGKTIIGYGAPGKGNTLLNYCGISTDFLDYTVDRNPYKQGKYTPGARIPIKSPDIIAQSKPDYILILPWNLKQEIMDQLEYTREWGCKFIIPIPEATII